MIPEKLKTEVEVLKEIYNEISGLKSLEPEYYVLLVSLQFRYSQ